MHQVTSWSYESSFPSEVTSAALTREFARARLVEHGFTGLLDEVCLVATELATNAILHAQTPFTVILRGDGDAVTLTVRDGSTLTPALPVTHVIATHGRGLAIVAAFSDRWGTTLTPEGGKAVWARFKRAR